MSRTESRADAQAPTNPELPARPVPVAITVRLVALAVREPDGRYSVAVPALRGCYCAADTIEDVESNATEAAEGWLEAMHDARRDQAVRDMTEPLPSEIQP
jgi:predicted RNase H-like HicB family nuclease